MANYLKTNLAGKVNNLPHFKTEALFPVFEAITNSIQAIEERGISTDKGKIDVTVIRQQEYLETSEETPVVGFKIEDNGIGFDNTNFESFFTSDTNHKIEKGCKGIGRFFWLKAFSQVDIASVYQENAGRYKRIIGFNVQDGIKEISNTKCTEELYTLVHLNGFKREYQKLPTAYKTTSKIAQRILEHTLSYFICGKAPLINLHDGVETINLNDQFSKIKSDIVSEEISLKGDKFTLYHLKLYSTTHVMNQMVYCGNYREVASENFSKHLGVNSQFDEEKGKFAYSAYVTGNYLDKNVDSSRLEFTIPDGEDEAQGNYLVTMSDLRAAVVACSKRYLKDYLLVIMSQKKDVVEKYVSNENPTLKAVAHYCPDVYNEIEPNSSPERIDEILYKHKGRMEYQLRKESQKLLKTQPSSVAEIQDVYKECAEKLEAIQKDELASYVLYRKLIIDLLGKKLEVEQGGKYPNEDIIHDIIFPRKANTHAIGYEDHNLWLLSENLTFHEFASSDTAVKDISSSVSDERPDIAVFSEMDEATRTARSCSIIEFKKPQRKNFDQDPTAQMYDYLRKIKGEKIFCPNGRPLLVDSKTRFYLYAICDINEQTRKFADNGGFAELHGELGYYFYNPKMNAHVEIIAFDKIIIDAKQRHKIYFEKLKIK